MKFDILQGNVFDMLPLIPKGSIDACVTSPPYWQLRSYLPKHHALKPLELGLERTPAEFVANMVKVFSLVRDALADHGTLWVNIGDTYAQSQQGRRRNGPDCKPSPELANHGEVLNLPVDAGNRCLIPERLAIALQDDGWIVRSVIVWSKPAPMPASLSGWMWRRCRVKVASDRGSRLVKAATTGNHRAVASFKDDRSESGRALSAEGNPSWSDCPGCKRCIPNNGLVLRRGSWRPTSAWEPILMLAKTSDYFADGEAVKTKAASEPHARGGLWSEEQTEGPMNRGGSSQYDEQQQDRVWADTGGANLRDVWTIASEPLKERHYASFPTKLVENCLRAATSAKGYCPACGKPWCRVVETTSLQDVAVGMDNPLPKKRGRQEQGLASMRSGLSGSNSHNASTPQCPETRTLDWRPSCQCPDAASLPPRPGRVLDPFAGSGRTLLTARRLGLDAVGVELNPEYAAMARRILTDDMPLFASVDQPE